MSVYFRTAKKWRDADNLDLLIDWTLEDDGDTLIVMLDFPATVAARKDESIAMRSQWRYDGDVYETTSTTVLPAGGLMRVVARR